MFKVNNKDTNDATGVFLVSLLLTLNMFHTLVLSFLSLSLKIFIIDVWKRPEYIFTVKSWMSIPQIEA